MKYNKEIYDLACQFYLIANYVNKQKIESDNFHCAYNMNVAFSIELFLKSIEASSSSETIWKFGATEVMATHAESQRKGHDLQKLFQSLSSETKDELSKCFAKHEAKVENTNLHDLLGILNDSFISSRYSYEKGSKSPKSFCEPLRILSLFFKDTLQQQACLA